MIDPLQLVLKTTVVLSVVLLGRLLLARASAATRHLWQVLGLGAALLLPLAAIALPAWELVVPAAPAPAAPAPARDRAPAAVDETASTLLAVQPAAAAPRAPGTGPSGAAPSLPAPRVEPSLVGTPRAAARRSMPWLPLIWAAGFLIVAGRSLAGWRRMAAVVRAASPIRCSLVQGIHEEAVGRLGLRRAPRLVRSARSPVPMLFGLVRPALILPAESPAWSAEKLRLVLLHELAHHLRADAFSLLLGRLVTAVYWFHPLAWAVDRGARRDCERACDDVVLGCGERPSSYAGHLVAIAARLSVARPPSAALAIAGSSSLERRVRSILHPRRSRGLGGLGVASTLAAILVVLAAVSSARVVAAPPDSQDSAANAREIARVLRVAAAAVEGAAREAATGEESGILLAQHRRDDDLVPHHHKDADHEDHYAGEAAFERAYKLHREERFEEAIAAFREAADAGYRTDVAMYNAACGYARLGNAAEAVAWIERALDAGFDSVELIDEDSDLDPIRADRGFRALLGRIEEEHGHAAVPDRYDATLQMYDALLERDSTDGDAWYEVGSTLLRLRELDRGIDALQRAERYLGHDNQNALYNQACAYALRGDATRSLDLLERAVLAGFGNDERFRNDSDLDGVRDDPRFDEIRALGETLSLDRFREHDGADARYSSRRWAPAVEEFQAFVEARPEVGRGWFDLGWALHYSRRHAEAREAFARAAELEFRTPTSMYNVACACAMEGAVDAALDWLDRAVDAGFDSAGHMEHDDDLASLRGNARFEEILDRVEEADHDHDHDRSWWKRMREALHLD